MDELLASLNEATEALKSALEAMERLKAKYRLYNAAGKHEITDGDLKVIENLKCTRKNYYAVSNRARRFFDRTIEEMLETLDPTPTASEETADSSGNIHKPNTPETTWHNNALDPNQDD